MHKGKLTILVLAGTLASGGLSACSAADAACTSLAAGADAYAAVAMKGGGGGHPGGGSGSGGKSGTSGGTGKSGTTSGGGTTTGGSAGSQPRSYTAPLRPLPGVPGGYTGFRPYAGAGFGYYYRGVPYPWWYSPGSAHTGCQPAPSPSGSTGGGTF